MDAQITAENGFNVDDLYDQQGVAAVYTSGGSSFSCTVLVDNSEASVQVYLQADAAISIISVRKSEVPAVHLTGDKITIGTVEWRVVRILFEDDFEFRLLTEKSI